MGIAITFDGARLAYGSRVVLEVVGLSIPRGSVTTVIGPNGSGKSTLLHAIAGLLRPMTGLVDVHGPSRRAGKGHIAYVLQDTEANRLLPMTVREVVMVGRYGRLGFFGLPRAEDRAAVEAAMARMDVIDLAGRQLRELSGGQRQRVLVAQGLAQGAEVLLLDEPVTGLDLVSQGLIVRAIEDERSNGATVVLTSHDLADAERSDLVVLLAGKVVAFGPPREVLTPRLLREAYGGQVVTVGRGLALDDVHDHGAHDHGAHEQLGRR